MTGIIRGRRRLGLGLAGVLLMAAAGCGDGVQAADPGQARQVLGLVLDAWKAGEPPTALGARTPAIVVKDTDWERGARLVGYQAGDDAKLVGYDVNYPVVLELKDRKGKVAKKAAVYTVTTSPQVLVLRQEG